ncbi:MAG TPA: ABC transporter ATP-binding protein [Thermoanaerobaculia bacterium]
MLSVRDVHKSFPTASEPVVVLRGVSFDLAAGESLAITGPSGSGKSTLLHMIGTLDRPTAGTITIGGADPFALPEPALARFRNETVGFVFQDSHLLPQFTVLENVLIPTRAFPKKDDAEARAAEILDRVGLSHRLRHRPAELSGGERQRVAVARALINRPSLLLCDEPTGSLDRAAAGAVADLLFELHEALKTVLVVVTHSLELAARFPRRCELVEGRCSFAA